MITFLRMPLDLALFSLLWCGYRLAARILYAKALQPRIRSERWPYKHRWGWRALIANAQPHFDYWRKLPFSTILRDDFSLWRQKRNKVQEKT